MRRFGLLVWLSLGVALTLAATACGSAKTTGATKEPGAPAAAADPNGVMRLGTYLSTGSNIGIHFDLTASKAVPPQYAWMVYDTLLREDPDGKVVPGLAKSASIVDASTLKVELQPNVKFSDGTPMNPESVKFTIERNIKEQKSGSFEVELLEYQSMTIDSPTSFTIKLKTPIAGAWYRLLRLLETSPISPTALQQKGAAEFDTHPVGAGPFMVESITGTESIKLKKNPTYFQADKIKLAGVEFVDITSQATVTALRAGSVDAMYQAISITQAGELQGAPGVKTESKVTDNVMMIGHICKSRAPLNDVRVRQALNYAIDRKAVNDLVYGGKAEPMAGFWKSDSPYHNKALDNFYAYNPEKAKQLLADAGLPNGFTFDSIYTIGTDSQKSLEVVQQQWAKVGIKVNLKQVTNSADFFPDAKPAPMNWFGLTRTALNKVTRVLVPGSYGDVCTWNDPELNRLVKSLQAIKEDSPEGITLWQQIEEQAVKTGAHIFGLFTPQAKAWNDNRLGNLSWIYSSTGQPLPNFYTTFIKKT
jgi:ABC-type transport system substrate-binding protein